VIQYHPAKSAYVNRHETTLHLGRRVEVAMPTPPKELVGERKERSPAPAGVGKRGFPCFTPPVISPSQAGRNIEGTKQICKRMFLIQG
jgi:hypothetical protein